MTNKPVFDMSEFKTYNGGRIEVDATVTVVVHQEQIKVASTFSHMPDMLELYDARERGIRKALIGLGWMPPPPKWKKTPLWPLISVYMRIKNIFRL